MIVIDVIKLAALGRVKFHPEHMIAGVAVVSLVENAKVLARQGPGEASLGRDHKDDPVAAQSLIPRSDHKDERGGEGEDGAVWRVLERDWLGMEGVAHILSDVVAHIQEAIGGDPGHPIEAQLSHWETVVRETGHLSISRNG